MGAVLRSGRFLEVIFPALCPGCQGELGGARVGLCENCLGELLPLAGPGCPSCGRPVSGMEEFCLDCLESPGPGDRGLVWGEYQGVLRRALLALKHGGHDELAPILGGLLSAALSACSWISEVDLVTAIPSHPIHRIRRGYSAAGLLAQEVAKRLNMKYSPILRRRGLRRQALRSRGERLSLGSKEFVLRRDARVKGFNVLLVDDVLTTGATMRRVVGLLRRADSEKIFTVVLAWSAPSGSWG